MKHHTVNSAWVQNARIAYMSPEAQHKRVMESDASLDKHIRGLARKGFNAVQLWHSHYRFNRESVLPAIEEDTRRIALACHRHGMKVIEHHSATFVSNYRNLYNLKGDKRIINLADLKYKNFRLLDWAIRNVTTNKKFILKELAGWQKGKQPVETLIFCLNNPEWEKAWFDYILKFIQNTGVDALQHDDMHFAGPLNCGCKYCRAKFHKMFGYRLPSDPDHPAWTDLGHPIRRDFIRFRLISDGDHFKRLRRLLGKDFPVWTCNQGGAISTLAILESGDIHEELIKGVNVLYEEVSVIPKNEQPAPIMHFLNWEKHYVNRKYYEGISHVAHCPALIYFYPASHKEGAFCWALAKSFGAGLIHQTKYASPHLLDFEKKHDFLFHNTAPCANIGLIYSTHSAAFSGDHADRDGEHSSAYVDEFRGWCKVLIENHLAFRVIPSYFGFSDESLRGCDLVLLPNTGCLSNSNLGVIRRYVRGGGRVIVTHETSLYDETGARRKDFGLSDILGLHYGVTTRGTHRAIYPNSYAAAYRPIADALRRRQACWSPHVFCKLDDKHLREVIAWIEKYNIYQPTHPFPAIIANSFGKGRVIYFSFKPGLLYATESLCAPISVDFGNLEKKDIVRGSIPKAVKLRRVWADDSLPAYGDLMREAIRELLPDNELRVQPLNVPQGIICNYFRTDKNSIVISMLNVSYAQRLKNGDLIPDKVDVKYPDIFARKMAFRFNTVKRIQSTRMFSPYLQDSVALKTERAEGCVTVKMPDMRLQPASFIEVATGRP